MGKFIDAKAGFVADVRGTGQVRALADVMAGASMGTLRALTNARNLCARLIERIQAGHLVLWTHRLQPAVLDATLACETASSARTRLSGYRLSRPRPATRPDRF